MSHESLPLRRVDPYPNGVSQEIPAKGGTDDLSFNNRLRRVLNDVVLYRQLLRSKGTDAQALLDLFQSILDSSGLDTQFRRLLIVATQRLSRTSGLYPICYELKGVKQECEPVTAGGFADIYKGEFEGHAVCLKAIRIYQDTQVEHLLKQFSREVILWGQLSHANVLPIYKKRLCFVAPWMENGDIGTYLKQNPGVDRYSLAYPEIVAWTSLSTMSSKGGSLRWQAPELFDTEEDESIRNSTLSDVYALGCVYYEIFTGNIPFYGTARDSSVMLLIQRGSRPSRPLESSPVWRDWGLTETTWTLMQDCWSTQPSERPPIDQVINRLSLQLHRTPSRTVQVGGILSSTRFRGRIKEPLNEMTKSILDRLLYNVVESAKRSNTIGILASDHLHRVSSPNAGVRLSLGGGKSSCQDTKDDLSNSKTRVGNCIPPDNTPTTEFSSGASVSSPVKGVSSTTTDATFLKTRMVTANAQGKGVHSTSSLDYQELGSVKPICTNCGTTYSPLWRRSFDGDLICEACVQYLKLHIRLRPSSKHNTHGVEPALEIPADEELISSMGSSLPCDVAAITMPYLLHYGDTLLEKRSPGPTYHKRPRPDTWPSTGRTISCNKSSPNDSPSLTPSEVYEDVYTDMGVINRNKRPRLSMGERQLAASSMHDDRVLTSSNQSPISPTTLPDDDENKHSPMPHTDYDLDLTGIEALPMLRSIDESPTDLYRYLDPLFAWD
ncbi:hypothetical protein C0995_014017 [Termitomyces sp. Mi166|nr:hypothetical protein C0995_014017 [Termitomyces sp. Mi166\